MKRSVKRIVVTAAAVIALVPALAHAQEGKTKGKKKDAAAASAEKPSDAAPAAEGAAAPAEGDGERVNVERIKEKYWARGDESELGVVQNRLYSKSRRFELGLMGSLLVSDPFLSTKSLGASFGFHFNEYVSAHLLAWKTYVASSSANEVLEFGGKRANTNPPSGYYGAEARGSLIYGKLSVVGAKIIYYDLHLTGGMGVTSTETGKYFTPHLGLGQQIFLSRSASLLIDYRLMRYSEKFYEKQITPQLGQLKGPRTNWTHAITLGISFFFGKGSQ